MCACSLVSTTQKSNIRIRHGPPIHEEQFPTMPDMTDRIVPRLYLDPRRPRPERLLPVVHAVRGMPLPVRVEPDTTCVIRQHADLFDG